MFQSIYNVKAIAAQCFLLLVLLGTLETFARESRNSRSRPFIRPALRNRKSGQFNCPLDYAVKNVTFSYKTNRVLKVYCRRFQETNGTARLRKCEWRTNCTLRTEPLPKQKQIKDFTVETNVSSIPRAVRMFNVGRRMQPPTTSHRILLQCCNETCKAVNCTQRRTRLTQERPSTTDGWLREVLISTTYRNNVNLNQPQMRPMRYETCNYTCWGGYVHARTAVVEGTSPAPISPTTQPTAPLTTPVTIPTTTPTTTVTIPTTTPTTTVTIPTTTLTTTVTTSSTTPPTTTIVVMTSCSTAGAYGEGCPCENTGDCTGDLECIEGFCRVTCPSPGNDELDNCVSINTICLRRSLNYCGCAEIGVGIEQWLNNYSLDKSTLANFCCSGTTELANNGKIICAAPTVCSNDEQCKPDGCDQESHQCFD